MTQFARRSFLRNAALFGGATMIGSQLGFAQEPPTGATEPVYRISKNETPSVRPAHPLDPAINIAYQSLQKIRSGIKDYTAIMIKRERINGTLGDNEYLGVKIRNRKEENGVLKAPFSVYVTFLKPSSVKGREVIYVENQNEGNIVAHEGGMKGRFIPTMTLDPKGMIAMKGQRYPITEMGLENLVIKLIEKGERDRQRDECEVKFAKGAKLGGRPCTVLTVMHPQPRPYFDFHIAEIFIDDELGIPVRYSAYTWPAAAGGKPQLLEQYTYQNIRLNVGLTDLDFSRNNKKYNF